MNYPFIGLELLCFVMAPILLLVVLGLFIEATVRWVNGRKR